MKYSLSALVTLAVMLQRVLEYCCVMISVATSRVHCSNGCDTTEEHSIISHLKGYEMAFFPLELDSKRPSFALELGLCVLCSQLKKNQLLIHLLRMTFETRMATSPVCCGSQRKCGAGPSA